jgi:putative membrane protein
MRKSVKTSMITLAVAGAVALPTALPRPSLAADDSYSGAVMDKARNAGEATKDAAESAGSAVKNSAKSAAGYASDTVKDAGARLAGKDAAFVRKAAIGGMFEVKSAELAKTKTSSSEVKSFADKMVQDHTKANEELERLAKQKNFTLPTDLDNEHQAKLDKLAGLSGDAFDKAYLTQQRTGHEAMLRLMQDEAKNGSDPDLKSFAAKTKSTVAEHHARITKLPSRRSSSSS